MDLEPWDPWKELEEVLQEAERMLNGFLEKLRRAIPGEDIAFVPKMDVVETPLEYRFYVSLPGVLEEDIDLAFENGWLVVRGHREAPFDPGHVRRVCSELRYGFFERRFRLPGSVDVEKLSASFDSGLLTVRAPKKVAT